MINSTKSTDVVEGIAFQDIPIEETILSGEPKIFRGALTDSAFVKAARASVDSVKSVLQSYDSGAPVLSYFAPAEAKGRFFYNDDFTGLNFETNYSTLTEFLDAVLKPNSGRDSGTAVDDSAPAHYIGSADIDQHFPELIKKEGMDIGTAALGGAKPRVGIWIGNTTVAATHFDVSNNMAVCMAGKRRFTLFPPDQIENIYPGPLEPTPGGQVVSMVDVENPDFDKYPKFKQALEHAQLAELSPGDVLIYPAMWWHQVEALGHFNVMINYWWNHVEQYVDDPMTTLRHALLSLRARPDYEKQAWRNIFDYYVFGENDITTEHLPENLLGPLAPLDEALARRLRMNVIKKINR